ncbi:hypothetical protein D3C85_1122160 [compost metagenome]
MSISKLRVKKNENVFLIRRIHRIEAGISSFRLDAGVSVVCCRGFSFSDICAMPPFSMPKGATIQYGKAWQSVFNDL